MMTQASIASDKRSRAQFSSLEGRLVAAQVAGSDAANKAAAAEREVEVENPVAAAALAAKKVAKKAK